MKRFISIVPFCLSVLAAAANLEPGGVVVHLGSGNEISSIGQSRMVQGLDTSAEIVRKARAAIRKAQPAHRVSVRTFDGRTLPYIDNMVNLLIVNNAFDVPRKEMMRVLVPNGTLRLKNGETVKKPRPKDLDEWTHYFHNPGGTMVGKDQVVGPPRRIQWMGAPKWLRNHDFMSSMHALVSSNGRIFYVIDEGLRQHIFLPSRWTLIARDAFNGTVLWKRPLSGWHPSNWPLKSGPGHMPRRLVAVGDRVYVTEGHIAPVTVVDAATGKTIRVIKESMGTEEIILADGVLYLAVDPDRKPVAFNATATSYSQIGRANKTWAWSKESPDRYVMAVKPDTGKVLWKRKSKVAPLSMAVGDSGVFFHNGDGLTALDRKSGEALWTSEGPGVKSVPTGGNLRVVYQDGMVLFAAGKNVTGFSAKNGEQKWKGSLLPSSHHCPNDLFIIDGLVWSANTGVPQKTGTHLKAYDLQTGEVKKDFRAKNLPAFPMHPRCYPSRATTRFIMTNGMGTEFYEMGGDTVDINHTVRGSCIYGVMPCNGLLYKPPDSCACYYQSKLEHFCALAPAGKKMEDGGWKIERLEKGPAYNDVPVLKSGQSDWPMYRATATRSGSTQTSIPLKLKPAWSVDIGGPVTQPVAAYGMVFVAAKDGNAVHALDQASGKRAWSFTADGRIDSSPTLYKGRVLFGSADGRIYCLRAKDGALAWRHLAAPRDRQHVSYQQLESVWPVHGSVLVQGDSVYAVAGRNMFFDGGLRLVQLNPETGKLISETIMDENDPATGKNLQTLIQAKYMPIANADILSSDGKRLYMQEQNFDLDGKRLVVAPTLPGRGSNPEAGGNHLFCQTGLLDDLWFHRSFWIYGNNCGEGWGAYAGTRRSMPCGRIMSFDDGRAYAFRADPLGNMLHPRQTYTLYAASLNPEPAAPPAPAEKGKKKGRKKGKRKGGFSTHWKIESPPLLATAMALAGGQLVVAGPPDLADETKMLGFIPGKKDEINQQLAAQNEAWLGKHGSLLWIVDAKNGTKLAERKMDGVPVFDGMSAANGKLYLSMEDGRVVCLSE